MSHLTWLNGRRECSTSDRLDVTRQARGVRNPVRVPMEALVDYRGFRLSVMPFLPIHYLDPQTRTTVNKVISN